MNLAVLIFFVPPETLWHSHPHAGPLIKEHSLPSSSHSFYKTSIPPVFRVLTLKSSREIIPMTKDDKKRDLNLRVLIN
jgi:hypothetical protein